jgi:hypothetical protein
VPITLDAHTLDRCAGAYRVRAKEQRIVVHEEDRIFLQWGDGPRQEILPLTDNEFFVKDDSFTRVRFVADRGERPTSLEIQGIGPREVAHRIEKI